MTSVIEMTTEERETFLARPWSGVFSFNQPEGQAPISTPMWYYYEAGASEYWFWTPRSSHKGQLIHTGTPLTLVVQEESTGKYVTVRGAVARIEEPTPELTQAIAKRYGADLEEVIQNSNKYMPIDFMIVHVEIQRWSSCDYSKVQSPA